MLINANYFRGQLHIAGAISNTDVADKLNIFINQYENSFLQAALGYDLWNEFTSAVTASLVDGADPLAQKWVDLKDGVVFTNLSSFKKKFIGLANNTEKLSPTANYIYWKWQEDLAASTTGVGVVKPQAENSVSVSPAAKMVAAWNQMLRDVNILWEFLEANTATYTSYDTAQINYGFFGAYGVGVYHGQNQFGI